MRSSAKSPSYFCTKVPKAMPITLPYWDKPIQHPPTWASVRQTHGAEEPTRSRGGTRALAIPRIHLLLLNPDQSSPPIGKNAVWQGTPLLQSASRKQSQESIKRESFAGFTRKCSILSSGSFPQNTMATAPPLGTTSGEHWQASSKTEATAT